MRKERVDEFLSAYPGTLPDHKDFRSICKLLFTLSFGQTFFERRFSVNKAILDTNMQEEASAFKGLEYDDLQGVVGVPDYSRSYKEL